MGKPILCLDFDGVVHSYTSGWKGARNIPDPPVDGAMSFMQDALDAGWDVVIHSSRARYFGGIAAMRRWLREWAPDGGWYEVMGNPQLEDVRFTRWKPSAVVTIDDRGLTFTGRWPALADLKAFKPWKQEAMLKARTGDNLIFGLSAGNIERLMEGKPISIDLKDLGLEKGRVMIFYGKTEEDMKRELIEAGMVLPS